MSKMTEYCASNHQPADFTKTELEHWFDDSYTNAFHGSYRIRLLIAEVIRLGALEKPSGD